MKDNKLRNLGYFMFWLFTILTFSLWIYYSLLFQGVDWSKLSTLVNIMYGLSFYGATFFMICFIILWYSLFFPTSESQLELEEDIEKLKKKYNNKDVFRLKRDELEAEYKLNKIRNKIKEYRSI